MTIFKNNSGYFADTTVEYIRVELGIFESEEALYAAYDVAKDNIVNGKKWIFRPFVTKSTILLFIEQGFDNERIVSELKLVFSTHHQSRARKQKLFSEIDKLRK